MDNKKLKRFQVTQSLRFGSGFIKGAFFFAMVMELAAIITLIVTIINGSKTLMGASIVVGIVMFIWMFGIRLVSDNTFGYANISFYEGGIIFRVSNAPDAKHYTLRWSDCVECGIEKPRFTRWVYASDHKLTPAERKEFPENVKQGVFYFDYAYNTWEEFMTYLPERFQAYMIAEKAAKKAR